MDIPRLALILFAPGFAAGLPGQENRNPLLDQAEKSVRAVYERGEFRTRRFRPDWLLDSSGYTVPSILIDEPDATEIARPDLRGVGNSNLPGLSDPLRNGRAHRRRVPRFAGHNLDTSISRELKVPTPVGVGLAKESSMTNTMVLVAGLVQLGIALSSLALPRILNWREQTARLDPLTRHVFWTYAGYIFGTNVCLGLVSAIAPHLLTDGSPLARLVCGFITTYWGVRVAIQFLAYSGAKPPGWFYRGAEIGFTLAFTYCAVTFGAVALAD